MLSVGSSSIKRGVIERLAEGEAGVPTTSRGVGDGDIARRLLPRSGY
jgi:hypothetical protein